MKEDGYHPTQYNAYFTLSSLFQVVCMIAYGIVFMILSKFEFGKNLLLKVVSLEMIFAHPSTWSHRDRSHSPVF